MKIATRFSWSGLSGHRFFVFFWLAVALLATGQDALFAFLKDTSFYWSESLLYKVYWLLFIPMTVLVSMAAKRFPVARFLSFGTLTHVGLAVFGSLLQILFFSVLVAVMSEVLLGYPFSFPGILRKSLAEDFFTGILMYALLLLLSQRFSGKNSMPQPAGEGRHCTGNEPPFQNRSVFLVRDGAKTVRLAAESIDWIGSEDSYTVLHRGNQKWLCSESLLKLESQLDPDNFTRIHRSCIVNVHRVRQVTSRLTGDYDVHLENGVTLRLSRSHVKGARGRLL